MTNWRGNIKTPIWKKFFPLWMHGLVILGFQFAVVSVVIGLGVAFFYFLLAWKFDLEEVARLAPEVRFYDRKGKKLEFAEGTGRKLVTREEIPDFLLKALAAREDARFFEHGGVDYWGLARATLRNFKDRDFTQGASTLTMQLARNTYEMRAKSLHRKALEIALTFRIEARYSKDEILTSYLNRIYYGAGAYGLAQAAQTYFGKKVSELHFGECAMLAGIIRGPHIFSPLRNLEAALEQRDQTLARMVAENWISEEEMKAIKAMKIHIVKGSLATTRGSYAIRRCKAELENVMERGNLVLNGAKVFTTLDAGWQASLERELTLSLKKLEGEKAWLHPKHGSSQTGEEAEYLQMAAVTVDTKTGGILAYIGGRDFEGSRFDRVYSKRDMGGVFEPFIAAAVAERGKLVLPGRPVQTGRQIGPDEVKRIAKRCGIDGSFLTTEDLFRGAVAASPMEIAWGLATLGNKGKKPDSHFISRIEDSEGNILYQAKVETSKALSEQAAKEGLGLLEQGYGGRYMARATSSERDAWVLRLGNTGSTVIWLGFDRPKEMTDSKRLHSLLEEIVRKLGS